MRGQKELLGLWISDSEGAKFWPGVLTELQRRGLKDIFFACVDGLSGFPDAIAGVYPRALTQQCRLAKLASRSVPVHMVRNSLKYVTKTDMHKVAKSPRPIYSAATLFAARQAFDQMEEDWGEKYPAIPKQWRAKWESLIVLFEYPDEIRKAIDTTVSFRYSVPNSKRDRIGQQRDQKGDQEPEDIPIGAVGVEGGILGDSRGIKDMGDADPEVEGVPE